GFLRGPAFPGSGDGAPPGETLPESLAAHLALHPEAYLRPRLAAALPGAPSAELRRIDAEALIAVRRGGALFGAFTPSGPLDAEALRAAVALADHLALRLHNHALVAEQLRLEREMESARHLASLGTLAAAVAHDIRTPLTSVQMNVQILRSKTSLPPDDM